MDNVWLKKYIYSTLAGDAALSALVGNRFYDDRAPLSTQYPFIIFQIQDAKDISAVGAYRLLVEYPVIIKAVDQVASYNALGTIADRIEALFHGTNGENEGIKVLFSKRERPFEMPEQDGEKQFRHLGGFYRFYIWEKR